MTDKAITRKTGRRKTSIAQVKMTSGGKGAITVNGKPVDEFFRGCFRYQTMVKSPVTTAAQGGQYDYAVKVNGGGIAGQAGAARHAVARAIAGLSEECHKLMKKAGFLTRDPRMVERKKPGQPKARKRFQYSKR